MKYVWKFEVVNRPSKETVGVTNVSQDFTVSGGKLVAVGSITKARGEANYVALNLTGATVGEYSTRSKAAHALRQHRVANATVTVETTEPEIVEPATTEPESDEGDLGGEAA